MRALARACTQTTDTFRYDGAAQCAQVKVDTLTTKPVIPLDFVFSTGVCHGERTRRCRTDDLRSAHRPHQTAIPGTNGRQAARLDGLLTTRVGHADLARRLSASLDASRWGIVAAELSSACGRTA